MTAQSTDEFIVNYQTSQKQKHAQFLKELKHEFNERTRQQRRDRLNQINPQQVQGLSVQTSLGRHRTAIYPRGNTTGHNANACGSKDSVQNACGI